MTAPFRRIVTGHDNDRKAIIVEDSSNLRILKVGADNPVISYEIWSTRETPAQVSRSMSEPIEEAVKLSPPDNGTRIRVIDVPPEEEGGAMSAEAAAEHFARIGASDAISRAENKPHPFMHRTRSVDYGIVLEGEIVLIVDKGETTVRAGDVVVQCGTNHSWASRSGKVCRMAFVLIDGRFDADIA
jgi:mannose-6-phosphate isomerase-like protein (cupin superfamily)